METVEMSETSAVQPTCEQETGYARYFTTDS